MSAPLSSTVLDSSARLEAIGSGLSQAGKGWIDVSVQLGQRLRLGQQRRGVSGARAVHGVHGDPDVRLGDRVQVHEPGHLFQVRGPGVEVSDQSLSSGGLQGQRPDASGLGDLRFDTVGYIGGGASGVVGLELEAVPSGGVMACGDYGRARGLPVQDVVADHGSRCGRRGEEGGYSVARHHLGDPALQTPSRRNGCRSPPRGPRRLSPAGGGSSPHPGRTGQRCQR